MREFDFYYGLEGCLTLLYVYELNHHLVYQKRNKGKGEKGRLFLHYLLIWIWRQSSFRFYSSNIKSLLSQLSITYGISKGSAMVKALGKISIVNMQTVTDMCPVNIIYSPSRRVLGKWVDRALKFSNLFSL